MGPNETASEPTYLGNLLFLIGAFFMTIIATATVVSLAGFEGIVGYAVGAVVFTAVFVGILAFYSVYYLSN